VMSILPNRLKRKFCISILKNTGSEPLINNPLIGQVAEIVKERTNDLLMEIEENRRAQEELKKSYEELEISKMATLELLKNLKAEMEQRWLVQQELIIEY
jgi:hypothetical protein